VYGLLVEVEPLEPLPTGGELPPPPPHAQSEATIKNANAQSTFRIPQTPVGKEMESGLGQI
jgi:hypothetical protein